MIFTCNAYIYVKQSTYHRMICALCVLWRLITINFLLISGAMYLMHYNIYTGIYIYVSLFNLRIGDTNTSRIYNNVCRGLNSLYFIITYSVFHIIYTHAILLCVVNYDDEKKNIRLTYYDIIRGNILINLINNLYKR